MQSFTEIFKDCEFNYCSSYEFILTINKTVHLVNVFTHGDLGSRNTKDKLFEELKKLDVVYREALLNEPTNKINEWASNYYFETSIVITATFNRKSLYSKQVRIKLDRS